ncbi:fibropellin-1-like [Mya arenaria]|uniref:fibropellin-1-like n=1 Tax=Mya arenaria TaxID=6604 RepID=UPI0022E34789|nr:fibropellin-1-like [Mya arenaria]
MCRFLQLLVSLLFVRSSLCASTSSVSTSTAQTTTPDPCAGSLCLNNATCAGSSSGYTCKCLPGFTGARCENDVDECLHSPCANNALCHNTFGDYTCFCRAGFAGKNCSDPDFCASNPCQGQGQCHHNVTSFYCDCFHGYSGQTCQIDVDACLTSPCKNGATCQDLVGDYTCTCPPEFTDKHCQTKIDYCDPSPCRNGGTCRLQGVGYVCDCPDDVIGLNCELPIQQMCDGDESFCTCMVDEAPIHVPVPDAFRDDERERYLLTGIIAYPTGLVLGAILCTIFHYLLRPRCCPATKRPSSAVSARSDSSLRDLTFTPPPRYSSLGFRKDTPSQSVI